METFEVAFIAIYWGAVFWIVKRLEKVDLKDKIPEVFLMAVIVWSFLLYLEGTGRANDAVKETKSRYECIIDLITTKHMDRIDAETECE